MLVPCALKSFDNCNYERILSLILVSGKEDTGPAGPVLSWIQYQNYFFANTGLVLMAEVDPEALADVAYGIFEHLLNRGLRAQDKYLYALVEGGVDFRPDLTSI